MSISEERDVLLMQEAYKAIADPTRRRILHYLRGGTRTAGELAEYAGIARTALSHHLTVLKLADLVRVERHGQFQVYSLNTTVFQDVMTEVLDWFGGKEPTASQTGKALSATPGEDASDVSREERYEQLQ